MAENVALRIADIIVHADLQTREGINEDHAGDLADAVRAKVKLKRPRVMLIDDPEDTDRHGKLYAIDQHRVVAYKLEKRITIPVTKLVGSWQDARDLATSANAEHTGLKRSREDKERAVMMCLADHPEWPDQQIAKHTKTSATMVGTKRPKVPAAAAVKPGQRTGPDGKTWAAPSANKKRAAKPPPAPDDPERFRSIENAFTNLSRAFNDAIEQEGSEKLIAYFSMPFLKLIVHESKVVDGQGQQIAGGPRFRGFPGLRRVVRYAALPGRARTEEQVKQEYRRQEDGQ